MFQTPDEDYVAIRVQLYIAAALDRGWWGSATIFLPPDEDRTLQEQLQWERQRLERIEANLREIQRQWWQRVFGR
jgi:2-hydroxychromene-2-carboxylate isomerase